VAAVGLTVLFAVHSAVDRADCTFITLNNTSDCNYFFHTAERFSNKSVMIVYYVFATVWSRWVHLSRYKCRILMSPFT